MTLSITKRNLGIIFMPRSGSHVLEHYLSEVMEVPKLGEIFNTHLQCSLWTSLDSKQLNESIYYSKTIDNTLVDYQHQYLDFNLSIIANQIELGDTVGTFKCLPTSWVDQYPQFSEKLSKLPDTQFIKLDRADVLYSLLSIMIARRTEVWHNTSLKLNDRGLVCGDVDLDTIRNFLRQHIAAIDNVNQYFPDIQTIYYEEFQSSPSKLRNLFTGIPKQLVSFPVNKFSGNYKDLVTNIDEIEEFYEDFVNEHKEYFPQYFGKLPHIEIPKSQGSRPYNLSTTLETV